MRGYIISLREKMKSEHYHDSIIQIGTSVIIENNRGEILLQKRSDNYQWGLPGGSQEPNETLEESAVREVKEETNLDIDKNDLKFITILSGKSRYYIYPNGDQVYNDTIIFYINRYEGQIKIDDESLDMRFFSLTELPDNLFDREAIDVFLNYRLGEIL